MANSYSRGDREFDKAAAMLFPSEIAQRGRIAMGAHKSDKGDARGLAQLRFSVGTRQAQINKDKADRRLEAERLRDRQWPSELEKIVIPVR